MGGSGSGRWGGHARRATGEEAFGTFDVSRCAELLEEPDGTRGEAHWGDARIGLLLGSLPNGYKAVRLAYSIEVDGRHEETIRETVAVEPIPQPFGGRRWYFRCPRCGRRCAHLYVLTWSFRFRCRQCHRLAYHVQRLDRVSRRQRAFRRMVRRLGADPETDGWHYLPSRPPGMRRTTYARWESRWDRLEETYEREFGIDFVRRFGRWLAP